MGRERGFTLLELVMVIAVIAILAAIATHNLLQALDRGKQKASLTFILQLKAKAESATGAELSRFRDQMITISNNGVSSWERKQILRLIAFVCQRIGDESVSWNQFTAVNGRRVGCKHQPRTPPVGPIPPARRAG